MEHYNEAEPITTKCPLLPGQPLNVLNVPILLPDSRSHGRSSSQGSQKSDYRTMNPEDKYMNPRKPPKPDLARLQTSAAPKPTTNPSSTSPLAGMIHRSASQPSSAKYGNQWKDARSVSPPRSRGLRAAFRPANEADGPKWHAALSRSKTHSGTPKKERFFEERHKVLGINVNAGPVSSSAGNSETSAPSTIQTRRALKANGGGAGQARNLLTVETRPPPRRPSFSKAAAASKTLVTVDETQAIKDAPTVNEGSSGDATPTGPDLHEKRLPSLPNTPSSVMDEAVRAIDENDKALDAEVLRSHFSSLTTTTADESTHSRVPERSRFSEWSTDTEAEDNLPESMISASTFNNGADASPAPEEWKTPDLSQPTDAAGSTDPNTPHLTVHSKPSSPNSASGGIPPWNLSLPQLTVSLSSPRGSGLGIEQMDEVESNPKRHAALFSAIEAMEALSLSRSPNGSPILLPQMRESDSQRSGSDRQGNTVRSQHSDTSFRGKATMQEMLDELSYLKNMIQAEMDGEPF